MKKIILFLILSFSFVQAYSQDCEVCAGEPISQTLSVDPLAGYTIDAVTWSNGATGTTTVVTAAGTYTATIEWTNSDGCSGVSTGTTTITENPAPVCTVTGPDAVCEGNDLILDVNGSGGTAPYTYSSNNGTFSGTTLTIPNVTADGSVTVTITDANGCTSTCDHAWTINDSDDPLFNVKCN